jgi:dTMP kinase
MSETSIKPGEYIVVDGIDGGGKGSLFEALNNEFSGSVDGRPLFYFTREPGGTVLGEKIRDLLLNDHMSPESELDLFHAQRRELRTTVLRDTLARGTHVISDRSDSSTFAYQIRGRNRPELEKEYWLKRGTLLPPPTFYIFLDLHPEIAASRIAGRNGESGDRFDRQGIEFFTRVRQGFIDFAREVAAPCVVVDASQSKEEVANEVISHIQHHIF